MHKPMILAALAVTATLASAAYAQQATTGAPPAATQVQQRGDNDDAAGDDRGGRRGRWQRNSDREDRGGWRRGEGHRHGGRMARMCGPDAGRRAEARLDRIEKATRPTAEQKAGFDNLKAASAKATEIVKAACPTEASVTPPGRLAATEKRLTAMLEAVRTVRPAMESYYNSLTDEQKARLTMSRRAMNHQGGDRDEGRRGDRGQRRGDWRDGDQGGDHRQGRMDRWRDRDEDGDSRGGDRGYRRTSADATEL